MAARRIAKDLAEMDKAGNPECYTVAPTGDDLTQMVATFIGPKDSPYEGGCFFMDIKFPLDYPLRPPTVNFTTKIFHPNIDQNGRTCLRILRDDWNPATTIKKVMEMVYSMFVSPDFEESFVPEVHKLYRENPEKFDETAREWTKKYAN